MKNKNLIERYNNYHPIDKFIYVKIVDKIDHIFKDLGFTPNHITILSLLIRLYSLYLLKKNHYFKSIILFNIGFIFDCMDGHMARKYNMGSKFGDKLDHYSDWFLVLISFFIYKKKLYFFGKDLLFSIISLLILFLNLIDVSLHEKIENKEYTSFKFLKKLKINTKWKKFTKYFGVGIIPLYNILSVLYIKYRNCK